MEKYLEKLLSQIRCKKARPYIAEEIRCHIESQIEDNISGGMAYEALNNLGDSKSKVIFALLISV